MSSTPSKNNSAEVQIVFDYEKNVLIIDTVIRFLSNKQIE